MRKKLIVIGGALIVFALIGRYDLVSDPTEATATLTLRNDLGVSVGVAPCEGSSCDELAGTVRDRLAPRETLAVNLSDEGVLTPYRVDLPDGQRLCLMLVVHDIDVHPSVPLSEAHKCM
jgi:hypothetical protein